MGKNAMALKIYERHLAREILCFNRIGFVGVFHAIRFFDLIHELESIGRGVFPILSTLSLTYK